MLLAGVVAVNVSVLRLNVQLDQVGRERSELKADIAELRSGLSSASATARVERIAEKELGLVKADPETTVTSAAEVRARAANRRIVLLAGAFVLLLAIALGRAFWLQAVNGDAYAAMAVRQHRETVVVPAGRGMIVDRNGEPLAIGKPTTTVFANPRQVDRRVRWRSPPSRVSGSSPEPRTRH